MTILGCSTHSVAPEVADAMHDAADEDSTSSPTYGRSACGTCVAKACDSSGAACASDAGCAGYLECINACPLASSGDILPSCASHCELPSASSSEKLAEAFAACETASAGSCSSCGVPVKDAGPDGEDVAPIPHESCSPSTLTDPCGNCQETKCCTTAAAVVANSEATAFAECISDCAGSGSSAPSCVAACAKTHASGVPAFLSYYACSEYNCIGATACDVSACDQCSSAQCGALKAECFEDEDCYLLDACEGDVNGSMAAYVACESAFPSAMTLHGKYGQCILANCSTSCVDELHGG